LKDELELNEELILVRKGGFCCSRDVDERWWCGRLWWWWWCPLLTSFEVESVAIERAAIDSVSDPENETFNILLIDGGAI